jgi:hypothetical protein
MIGFIRARNKAVNNTPPVDNNDYVNSIIDKDEKITTYIRFCIYTFAYKCKQIHDSACSFVHIFRDIYEYIPIGLVALMM